MAKKTIELTTQVEPNNERHVDDALGLEQHEAGPQEEHLAVRAGRANRGEEQEDGQRDDRHHHHAADIEGGDDSLAQIEEGPVVGREQVDTRVSTATGAIFCQSSTSVSPRVGGSGP